MQGIADSAMTTALEREFNRLVFPESECPTYHVRWKGVDGAAGEWTWTPRGGMQRGWSGAPTALIEIDADRFGALLPRLVARECGPQELLAQGAVRLGGNGRDILALENLWADDDVVADRNGARARTTVSTSARRALADTWRARVGERGDTARVLAMLDTWVDHRVSRCVLDLWTTLEIEGLPNRPWHDPSELPFDAPFRAAHDRLRAEAAALLDGTVVAPHYGGSSSDPDQPERNKPRGWRHYNLMASFERLDDHCARFPITAAIVDRLAAEHSIIHAGYLILEPGVVIPPHSDAANWCLSYHFGVIVPDGSFQTVAGETRFHREGGSMLFEDCYVHMAANHGSGTRVLFNIVLANPALTAAEISAIRALSAELPSGLLVYVQ